MPDLSMAYDLSNIESTASTVSNASSSHRALTNAHVDWTSASSNFLTSGTLGAGVATLATGSTIGNLTLADGSITDSSGTISFGNENLSTTGTLACGLITTTSGIENTTGALTLNDNAGQDITAFASSASGENYSIYLYGYKTGVGNKYLRLYSDSGGYSHIDVEENLYLDIGGVTAAWLRSSGWLTVDDQLIAFGTGTDYSMGYYSTDDEFQIVDGGTLDSSVRAKVNASGNWTFSGNIEMSKGYTWSITPSGDPNWGIKLSQYNTHLMYAPAAGRNCGIFAGNTSTWLAYCDGNSDFIITNQLGIGTSNPTANADATFEGGKLCLKETTTPTADADYGKIYTKNDNKLYCQTGDGVEHEIAFV